MKLTKVFCKNEDYIFPRCEKCKRELSSYCVTSEELNKIDLIYLKMLLKCELLRINDVDTDKHLIFVCKTCSDLTKDIV